VKRLPGTFRVFGGVAALLMALSFAAQRDASALQSISGYFVALIAFFVVLYGLDAVAEHLQQHTPPRRK
jgi:hypothetical protein